MLALKILIYALVNCGFSCFASLEIPLVIQFLKKTWVFQKLIGHPLFFVAIPALFRLSGTFSKKNYKNSCITKIIVVDLC